MQGLKRIYTTLAIVFPLLVVGVPGILFGSIQDPAEWLTLGVSAVFAALPFVATLLFMRRREKVMDDPVMAAGVRFAAKAVLWYNLVLWLIPLVEIIVMGPRGINFGWAFLLFAQPLYIYALLLLFERAGRRLAARRPESADTY